MAQLKFSFFFAFAMFTLIYDEQRLIYAKSISKRDVEKYPSKYDNIDIQKIVQSKRLMMNYGNCLLEKGPCTPDGTELKNYLPDAMQTSCVKCTEKQKKIVGLAIGHLIHNYGDLWEQLLQKYDPNGTFRAAYEGTDDDDDDFKD